MNLLSDCVLVQPDKAPEKKGLIYMPQLGRPGDMHHKNGTGTVLAVGPGEINKKGARVPMTVKPGDHVHYKGFPYPKVEKGIVVHEGDIYCRSAKCFT